MFRHLPKVRIFKKWITPHGWFLKRSLISVRNVSHPKVLVIYTYLNLTVLFSFFRSKRNHPCRMQRKVFPSHSTCFWMVSTSTVLFSLGPTSNVQSFRRKDSTSSYPINSQAVSFSSGGPLYPHSTPFWIISIWNTAIHCSISYIAAPIVTNAHAFVHSIRFLAWAHMLSLKILYMHQSIAIKVPDEDEDCKTKATKFAIRLLGMVSWQRRKHFWTTYLSKKMSREKHKLTLTRKQIQTEWTQHSERGK